MTQIDQEKNRNGQSVEHRQDSGNGNGRGNRWRVAMWTGIALIILLPLVAMQLTDEVKWSVADFAFAITLLLGTGLAYEFAIRKMDGNMYRAAVGIALVGALMLIWANGAVGIIGSENNDANLMYGGVIGVGIIGAIATRLRPRGMARVLFAMALTLGLIAIIALAAGLGTTNPIWPLDLLGSTGFFAILFVGSGMLFQRAARVKPLTSQSK